MIPQYTKNKNKGYIIESGSNSNGSYIKFSDGTMICFNEVVREINFQQNGSVYTGTTNVKVSYPYEFIAPPKVIINTESVNDYYYCCIYAIIRDQKSINGISFLRATIDNNLVNIPFVYTAIGKWK